MSDQQPHVRQWRIVALAVVSRSGRPLFLKNFPPSGNSGSALAESLLGAAGGSQMSTPNAAALELFSGDAAKSIAPWATKFPHHSSENDGGGGGGGGDGDSLEEIQGAPATAAEPAPPAAAAASNKSDKDGKTTMSLQQALSAALDCEDYTETETAQLFLYAALDRIDARRQTEERRSGNPFESRGYAVFDRETRTGLRAFVLVRYWGRSLPQECHVPCSAVLNQLIQNATYAYSDPFRDVALDEPLSEGLVLDKFLSGILKSATELPPPVAAAAAKK